MDGASQGAPGTTGDIDAVLWIGDPGDVGTRGVVNLLTGAVNPSGRTPDIYPYAVETTPSYYNFDTYTYWTRTWFTPIKAAPPAAVM